MKKVIADLALENRVPNKVRREIVDLELEEPTLSPRELAARRQSQYRVEGEWRKRYLSLKS